MKNLMLIFAVCFFVMTNAQAQVGTPAKQTFVCRSNTSFEQILVQSNNIGEVTELSYQSPKDKKPVKLKILKTDNENMRITTQRPDTKEKLVFSNTFAMAGLLYLADGSSKEFMPEIICKANTGEQISTSGAPMFLPYFYKSNEKNATFKALVVTQEQIGNAKKLPTGEEYYEVTLPNKKGNYKIAHVYDDDGKTRIKLVSPDNKITFFEGR